MNSHHDGIFIIEQNKLLLLPFVLLELDFVIDVNSYIIHWKERILEVRIPMSIGATIPCDSRNVQIIGKYSSASMRLYWYMYLCELGNVAL